MIQRGQIEEWDISRLSPYENNSKLHPDAQVQQIANSINEFTFLDPIAVDEKGEILEGHGRYLAAKSRGDKQVPVMVITGLTKVQKIAYRIAHNKLTTNTGFDAELLQIDFSILDDLNFDIDLTGFSSDELDNLLEGFGESVEASNDDEGIQESRTKEIDTDKYDLAHKCPKCGFEYD